MHTLLAALCCTRFTLDFLPVSVEVRVPPRTDGGGGWRGREERQRVGRPQDPRRGRESRKKARRGRHVGVSPVGTPPALPLVALDRLLQVVGVRQVHLQTLHGIKVFGVPRK